MAVTVTLDCEQISDWKSFHGQFQRAFGFPSFYGRNMDAWIDCMSSLDEPDGGMTNVHCHRGDVVTLRLENVKPFATCCPEQYNALIECSAFVNWQRLKVSDPPVPALSFRL